MRGSRPGTVLVPQGPLTRGLAFPFDTFVLGTFVMVLTVGRLTPAGLPATASQAQNCNRRQQLTGADANCHAGGRGPERVAHVRIRVYY